MSNLITAEQLAEALSLGVAQIRKLTREGQIPHYRIGGVIRYDLTAVKVASAIGKVNAEQTIVEMFETRIKLLEFPDSGTPQSIIEWTAGAAMLAVKLNLIDIPTMVDLLIKVRKAVKP